MALPTETHDVSRLVAAWAHRRGRRPRLLLAKIGLDGHTRGQLLVANAFAQFGFDVELGPPNQSAPAVAKNGIESDCDGIALSCISGPYQTHVARLLLLLCESGSNIPVILGGTIPEPSRIHLHDKGIAYIAPQGESLGDTAARILPLLERDSPPRHLVY